jgi:hypothetical protein
MGIEPPEVPPATPGHPTEPPRESPPGNPPPEVPPPVQEPGEPATPEELPGRTPDELPTRGPEGPRTPNPATDAGTADFAGSGGRSRFGRIGYAQRCRYGSRRTPEYAMNRGAFVLCAFTNKYKPGFEGRHNPA